MKERKIKKVALYDPLVRFTLLTDFLVVNLSSRIAIIKATINNYYEFSYSHTGSYLQF